MHVVATNICVWIRTLVKESLLEITLYHQKRENDPNDSAIAQSIRQHALRHAGTVLRTHNGPNEEFEVLDGEDLLPVNAYKTDNVLSKLVRKTVDGISKTLGYGSSEVADLAATTLNTMTTTTTTSTSTTTRAPFTTPSYQWQSTTMARKLKKFITSTTAATLGTSSSSSSTTTSTTTPSTTTTTSTTTEMPTTTPLTTTTTTELPYNTYQNLYSSASPLVGDSLLSSSTAAETTAAFDSSSLASSVATFFSNLISSTPSPTTTTSTAAPITTTTSTTTEHSLNLINNLMENSFQTYSGISHPESSSIMSFENYENLDNIYPAALSSNVGTLNSTACGRIDIMGTIVYDSAPYLYPFIIEYSLIGAVVLYVMWKHIGRYPGRLSDDDLEHRLEVMLSRRAVAMAQQARSGRVDCVGSSKGLFFGLLLLVGAMISLILFFVLVRHQQFSLLAIYLADASHCILMVFAILAIIIGFIR